MTVVVLACPLSTGAQKLSKDGLEQHMQVNHLAAALLTILLLPSLLRGSPSRVVVVNSMVSLCPLALKIIPLSHPTLGKLELH
jgi:NAD(P)-dependent dehydrogenase (short-subunit alcohol dehydrogenase family)